MTQSSCLRTCDVKASGELVCLARLDGEPSGSSSRHSADSLEKLDEFLAFDLHALHRLEL